MVELEGNIFMSRSVEILFFIIEIIFLVKVEMKVSMIPLIMQYIGPSLMFDQKRIHWVGQITIISLLMGTTILLFGLNHLFLLLKVIR
ncbi:hypothetical protein D0T11_19095 [Hymenobacter rubripertinctus]|uniref:Uncharacterized protein n=1 Tax=Hymenobacter rubripertinctus TaxID=2029981 RepID=A0A418QLY3_9BACT|nr:hypothetical protein D0T11_19095 [Hymenobacter rubripertinctus]